MNERQLDMVLEYLDINNEIALLINFDDGILEHFDVIGENSTDKLISITKNIISKFIDFLNRFINFLKVKALLLLTKNFQRIRKLIKRIKSIKIKESVIPDEYYLKGAINVPSINLLEKAVDCMIECVKYKKDVNNRNTYDKILNGNISKVSQFAEDINEIEIESIIVQNILNDEEKYSGKEEAVLNKLSIFLKKIVAVRNESKSDFLAADASSSKDNKKENKKLEKIMEYYKLSSIEYKNLMNFCVDVVKNALLYQYRIDFILNKFSK